MIKVIIADDEEKVCQLIFNLIDWKSLDMEVVAMAHNGVEALELIEKFSPDIVVTDIRMPGYDGLEMIGRAKNIKESIYFIIISGYSHFEYAQNAIRYGVGDYILKPVKKDELLNTLTNIREKYMQRMDRLTNEEHFKLLLQSDISKLRSKIFTEYLLQKGITTENLELEKINEDYHSNFKRGNFQVIAVKIDCGFEEHYNDSLKLLQEKVTNILNLLFRQECFDVEIYFNDSVAYCILNYDENNKKVIRHQIKKVLDELMVLRIAFVQFQFTIGVGSIVKDIKQLKETFRVARFAVGQRIIEGTGKIIQDVAVNDTSERKNELLAELNKTMAIALEIFDKDSVLSSIKSIKEKIEVKKDMSGHEIFSLAKHICEMYLVNLRNNQVELQNDEEFYEKFYIHSTRCGSMNQLFQYLTMIIEKSLDEIIYNKKQSDTKPIRTAKKYIQENYMSPICLEEIASIVGFNASYFSSLFKKESGVNFLEYLSEVRMNKAKELLRESNLSIAVICQEVGYNDLKHFTKTFKKNTGLKPNEYRKLYS
ncbi:response regulator [Clostridium sp. BSD9I1]|uniref:response regulator transcription factor n=1 Tax=Clostridium sp. BSD9I1 TaxID=2003589 RepID=UPI00164594A5|nr:response regulator [Clostridium sp. BSD9I1]